MKNEPNSGAQWWEAAAAGRPARDKFVFARPPQSTPVGSKAKLGIRGTFNSKTPKILQKANKTSGWAAIFGLRSGSIRKKIIGHRMRPIAPRWGARKHVRRPRGAFPLLEKPAGKHGGGVFLQPLVNQCGNFLAEIRGVSQTRKLKTLEGVARSREKELPRRLSRAAGHSASVTERCA
jgi:hypothetical protein